MMNLSITHMIYLTEDQRYKLFLYQDIEVVGVSIPIWFDNNITSEPAKEVFCNYLLKNPVSDNDIPIKILKDGYEIVLPCKKTDERPIISDDEYRKMSQRDLDKWYDSWPLDIGAKNLLNLEDGGSKHIHYREHNKMFSDEKTLNIIHYVNIDDISYLENSLVNLRDNLS